MLSRRGRVALLWLLKSCYFALFPPVNATICDYSTQQYNVSSQADADFLAQCSTVVGDVYIEANPNVTDIVLNGVQNVTGRFLFTGSRLESFLATDLVAIGEDLHAGFSGARNMTFSSLTTVGKVNIYDSGGVDVISFPAGLNIWSTGEPGHIQIDGTNITTLDGILFTSIDTLKITSNWFLEALTIPAETIGGSSKTSELTISNNGQWVEDTTPAFNLSLPKLTTLRGPTSIIDTITQLDVPLLKHISGDILIATANCSHLSFPALVDLTAILASDRFSVEDSQVDNIYLPVLTNITSLYFINNQGSLYDNMVLPDLQAGTSLYLEPKIDSYAGLNCSTWDRFYCNDTVKAVHCLGTSTVAGGIACSNESSYMSFSFKLLFSGILASWLGGAFIGGYF